jgi:hypothetical protein
MMLARLTDHTPLSPARAWTATLSWLVLTRAVIAAIGFVGVATFVNHHTLAIDGPVALDYQAVWHKWDARWYERIALHGYRYPPEDLQGQGTAAFFPLYPVTVGVLLRVVPFMSFFWLGTIVSAVCSAVALALAVRHFTRDGSHALQLLVLTTASAGSFYLTLPYTEGLFLLLVVLVLITTRRRRWLIAGALAGLAAVTRAHGFALLAVPAIACLLDRTSDRRTRGIRLAALSALFAVPVAVHMLYMVDVQGSAHAFVERQAMWNNPIPYPFRAVVGLLFAHPRRVQAWLHGGFWLLYLILLVRLARRMPPGEALFCLGALLISTQQESFQGIYRYITPLVPLTLALADERPVVRHALMALNVIVGTIMILAFVTNNRLAV